jgi:hypothetical protein
MKIHMMLMKTLSIKKKPTETVTVFHSKTRAVVYRCVETFLCLFEKIRSDGGM